MQRSALGGTSADGPADVFKVGDLVYAPLPIGNASNMQFCITEVCFVLKSNGAAQYACIKGVGEENLGIFEGSELQLYMKAGVASSEVGDAEGHVECGNGGGPSTVGAGTGQHAAC